ncbi:MAG: hypothetical protein ACI8UG_002049 [Gammaproteobacteria bacterium]
MTTIRTSVGVFSSIFVVSCLSMPHAQQANLSAHVHGVSELNIVIGGNKLEMQLRTPAINIVGFEHKASTEQQIRKVKQSEVKLNDHEALFSFSSGGCRLTQAKIDLSDLIEHKTTEKDAHDHHKSNLDHNHEHEDEDEHGDHSEIVAHYYYDCEDMNELSSISLGFFDVFPAMQQIKSMLITTSGQGAASLTRSNKTITF